MMILRMMKLTYLLFCFFYQLCNAEGGLLSVNVSGDIMITGLFPIHYTDPTSHSCDLEQYNTDVLIYSQAMVYAIELINNSSNTSGALKIGYVMYDTCSNVSMALNATMELLEHCNGNDKTDSIKAVIGERDSEISVAVARLLALKHIPQISYASTSEILNSREKFPSFFRTVPNDIYQAKQIAEMIKNLNYITVGIIGSNDEYGKYGSECLSDVLKEKEVCVEFKEIISDDTDNTMNLEELLNSSLSEAIVLFTNADDAKMILDQTIKLRKNRTWIASDGWSTSNSVSDNLSYIPGMILGVTCKYYKTPGFVQYVKDTINQPGSNKSFLSKLFYDNETKPVNNGNNCINKTCLMDFIENYHSYEPYTVYLAVKLISKALQSFNNTNFLPSQLTDIIKFVTLPEINKTFSKDGDLDIGYNILVWQSKKISTIEMSDLEKFKNNAMVTEFKCHKQCDQQFELIISESCCGQCKACEPGYFSDGNKCNKCNNTTDSRCNYFFDWTSNWSIALAIFTTIGLIMTITVAILLIKYFNTPVMKATGGCLCGPTLVSLLGCFTSVFFFLSKPTKVLCMTGMPLFNVSFSLCVSSILANLLQIYVGFSFKTQLGNLLKHIKWPPVVLIIGTSVQVILCTVWLVESPPVVIDNVYCSVGNEKYFIPTLVYNAFLCMVSFAFAFKGQHLPDLYRNASFIKISMFIYLVVWIVFMNVLIKQDGKYTGVYKALAILVSSYGILICHFAPKCYVLIWKKEQNDANKIAEYIRKYFEKHEIPVFKSR